MGKERLDTCCGWYYYYADADVRESKSLDRRDLPLENVESEWVAALVVGRMILLGVDKEENKYRKDRLGDAWERSRVPFHGALELDFPSRLRGRVLVGYSKQSLVVRVFDYSSSRDCTLQNRPSILHRKILEHPSRWDLAV